MTDFFDDDLVKKRESDAKDIRMGPGGAPAKAEAGAKSDLPQRPVSDLNLTRMARHKEQVEDQVATALKELERLKQRQQDLEKQRSDLEDLRKRQADYERGKREMLEHIGKSLVVLEKEEIKASQRVELLNDSRKKLKARLQDIEKLSEEQWPEEKFRDELGKALAVVEDARTEYNKLMARIDALGEQQTPASKASGERKPVIFEEGQGGLMEDRGFGHWLLVGMAVSLPLILTLALLGLFQYLMHVGHI